MENLVNKIQEILDINVTSYRISKITGITELVLSKYRKGTYNVKNMSLETADKLISNRSEIEKYAKWTDKFNDYGKRGVTQWNFITRKHVKITKLWWMSRIKRHQMAWRSKTTWIWWFWKTWKRNDFRSIRKRYQLF